MSTSQLPCSPLGFEDVFLRLLADMDGEIHRLPVAFPHERKIREKLVRYQTLIAAGGYLGTRAKEMLNLRWFDIVGKTENSVYEYKTGKSRKVYFAKSFIKIAERNYKLLDPGNIHYLVLHRSDNPMTPITTRDFNKNFALYLKKYHVETENPSSHTLRKTFMNEMWRQLGGDERAYLTVGKMMGYSDKGQVMDYLGHSRKQIKEAILRIR
jgi:integrase